MSQKQEANSERNYWLGFSLFPGIGPLKFSALLSVFGNAQSAWKAKENELRVVIGPKTSERFVSFRQEFSFEQCLLHLNEKNISFLTSLDDYHPNLLRQISNPPIVLFVKGNVKILNPHPSQHMSGDSLPSWEREERIVSIVGTRKITSYGKDVTEMITRELVAAGCIIVSGLALGVDAVAHKTTLAESRGKTIAVLGCGVDLCYPSANQAIYNSILAEGGAIVSEYPPGQTPSIGSFPSRNRIIAGLTQAVVVTEGAEDSGALITAKEALKNNRLVFAVPGPITSTLSKGPLILLKQGARIVTSGKDIIEALGIKHSALRKKTEERKGDTEEEQKIIDLLQQEPLLFDEIMGRVKISPPSLSMTLSLMEVKGILKKNAGRFSLVEV